MEKLLFFKVAYYICHSSVNTQATYFSVICDLKSSWSPLISCYQLLHYWGRTILLSFVLIPILFWGTLIFIPPKHGHFHCFHTLPSAAWTAVTVSPWGSSTATQTKGLFRLEAMSRPFLTLSFSQMQPLHSISPFNSRSWFFFFI